MTGHRQDTRSPATRFAGALLVVGLSLAACGTSPASTPAGPASAPPGGTPPPSAAPQTTSTTPLLSSAVPSGSPSGSAPLDVARDPTLLTVLPDSVDGVSVTEEPDSFTDAVGDASFVANVDAAAFAIAVDAGDLASGVVAHLRPGVFSDAFFRDWRDTYDAGACAQAGGVVGNAEAPLGGRTVFITTCAAGLRIYHARVEERGVVVSMFSLGDRRFGERLMAGLRP